MTVSPFKALSFVFVFLVGVGLECGWVWTLCGFVWWVGGCRSNPSYKQPRPIHTCLCECLLCLRVLLCRRARVFPPSLSLFSSSSSFSLSSSFSWLFLFLFLFLSSLSLPTSLSPFRQHGAQFPTTTAKNKIISQNAQSQKRR